MPALKGAGGDVSLLFANSNIDTREEFEKRLREAEKLASVEGVPIAALPYDHEEWLRGVAAGYEHEPEKGERCARCFRYNLGSGLCSCPQLGCLYAPARGPSRSCPTAPGRLELLWIMMVGR